MKQIITVLAVILLLTSLSFAQTVKIGGRNAVDPGSDSPSILIGLAYHTPASSKLDMDFLGVKAGYYMPTGTNGKGGIFAEFKGATNEGSEITIKSKIFTVCAEMRFFSQPNKEAFYFGGEAGWSKLTLDISGYGEKASESDNSVCFAAKFGYKGKISPNGFFFVEGKYNYPGFTIYNENIQGFGVTAGLQFSLNQ